MKIVNGAGVLQIISEKKIGPKVILRNIKPHNDKGRLMEFRYEGSPALSKHYNTSITVHVKNVKGSGKEGTVSMLDNLNGKPLNPALIKVVNTHLDGKQVILVPREMPDKRSHDWTELQLLQPGSIMAGAWKFREPDGNMHG